MLLCQDKKAPLDNVPRHALSLRALQKALTRCQPAGNCTAEVLYLGGITWLEGYVIDAENNDVLLYGQRLSNWPQQSTFDFVVALRNAWMKYAERRDNTIYYSDPGCSIDPDPEVIKQIENLRDSEKDSKRWEAICQSPQAVRVLGIPFDTSFAKIMVDADYFMKRIVHGTAGVNIPGFESLFGMRMRDGENKKCTDAYDQTPKSRLNRFWFYPGETEMDVDDNHRTTLVNQCQVTLKTEREHLSQQGIVAAGSPDPLADLFAEHFSAHYREISATKPIYKQLEQLYRVVAIAKLLKRESIVPSLKYLLDDFTVPTVRVERKLPGISHTTEKTYQCSEASSEYQDLFGLVGCSEDESASRVQHANKWEVNRMFFACGGVEVAIKTENARRRDLSPLRRLLIAARPSFDALVWVFGAQS